MPAPNVKFVMLRLVALMNVRYHVMSLLASLPTEDCRAKAIAQLYLARWQMEVGFRDIDKLGAARRRDTALQEGRTDLSGSLGPIAGL